MNTIATAAAVMTVNATSHKMLKPSKERALAQHTTNNVTVLFRTGCHRR
jgi:hypothetical protein